MAVRQRYFTPEEANAALPEVRAQVLELRSLASELRVLAADLKQRAEAGMGEEETEARARSFRAKQTQAEALVEKVRQGGVDLKGLDPILLDFPALRLGKEVYLCWREGEGAIGFWHPIETGLQGRQPLAAEDPGVWEWFN